MRTPREIAFRLRQEFTNALLFTRPPRLHSVAGATPLPQLPDPKRVAAELADTAFKSAVVELARSVQQHKFALLGIEMQTGSEISWRRDQANGKETSLLYFRRLPYLNAQVCGDHKSIWELNRHQHFVLLAQAFLFTEDGSFLDELMSQFDSWLLQNPFQTGINWTSALEVAFRALSWIWVYHLVGDSLPPPFVNRLLENLYRHGRHIENNLSVYFSPNTHLLGEAVAMHALGVLFPQFPRAGEWERHGGRIMADQLERQVRTDGSHFEQSTYYHVYALDMFLFHAILKPPSVGYQSKLARMAEYLHTLLGPSRTLPFLGDDDGGRFFHPFGRHDQFGRASIAACSRFLNAREWTYDTVDLYPLAAWWMDGAVSGSSAHECRSQLFADSGIAVICRGDVHIEVDAGPFGPWGSGHSHSDTLSLTVRIGDREILIDPGTYSYTDSKWRDLFRGSGAHNTIRIDGADQATPVNAFRWRDQPHVRIVGAAENRIEGECSYRGFTHRRNVQLDESGMLNIGDEVSGPPGEHEIEQFWHLGSPDARELFTFSGEAQEVEGWRSRAMGQKEPATVLRVYRRTTLPLRLETKIQLSARPITLV